MRKERVRRTPALMAKTWNKGRSTKKGMLSMMRMLHMRKKVCCCLVSAAPSSQHLA